MIEKKIKRFELDADETLAAVRMWLDHKLDCDARVKNVAYLAMTVDRGLTIEVEVEG